MRLLAPLAACVLAPVVAMAQPAPDYPGLTGLRTVQIMLGVNADAGIRTGCGMTDATALHLAETVRARLAELGITTTGEFVRQSTATSLSLLTPEAPGTPQFAAAVNLVAYPPGRPTMCAVAINVGQLAIATGVHIPATGGVFDDSIEIWDNESLGIAPVANMATAFENGVRLDMDSFATAWREANPGSAAPPTAAGSGGGGGAKSGG